VERARAIVVRAPKDPDAYFTLGLAQSEQDVEQAIVSFRRTLDIDPNHTLARYNLALVLKRADRAAEAVAELTRTLEIEPRAEIHYQLGVIHWQQGDLDRAAASLRAAVSADRRHSGAQATLGAVLRDKGDWRGATAALRRAIDLEPESWSAHYTLGRVLQLSGDDRGARPHFAEAERLRRQAQLTQEASVLTAVGTARLNAGDPAAAVRQFEQALTVFEGYAAAHYQLGRALQRLGRLEAARKAFARASQLNPGLVPPSDLR
jgi:tetratricopeptide (TPR) repeat protein